MTKRIIVTSVLFLAGLFTLVALEVARGSKFDWMKAEPSAGAPDFQLPEDADAWIETVMFSLLVTIAALANLRNAIVNLNGAMRALGVLFSVALLGFAIRAAVLSY